MRSIDRIPVQEYMEYELKNSLFFTEIHIKIVKHLLKCYFKHALRVLVTGF